MRKAIKILGIVQIVERVVDLINCSQVVERNVFKMDNKERLDYQKDFMIAKQKRKDIIAKQNPQQKEVCSIYHKIMSGSCFDDLRGDHK